MVYGRASGPSCIGEVAYDGSLGFKTQTLLLFKESRREVLPSIMLIGSHLVSTPHKTSS